MCFWHLFNVAEVQRFKFRFDSILTSQKFPGHLILIKQHQIFMSANACFLQNQITDGGLSHSISPLMHLSVWCMSKEMVWSSSRTEEGLFFSISSKQIITWIKTAKPCDWESTSLKIHAHTIMPSQQPLSNMLPNSACKCSSQQSDCVGNAPTGCSFTMSRHVSTNPISKSLALSLAPLPFRARSCQSQSRLNIHTHSCLNRGRVVDTFAETHRRAN